MAEVRENTNITLNKDESGIYTQDETIFQDTRQNVTEGSKFYYGTSSIGRYNDGASGWIPLEIAISSLSLERHDYDMGILTLEPELLTGFIGQSSVINRNFNQFFRNIIIGNTISPTSLLDYAWAFDNISNGRGYIADDGRLVICEVGADTEGVKISSSIKDLCESLAYAIQFSVNDHPGREIGALHQLISSSEILYDSEWLGITEVKLGRAAILGKTIYITKGDYLSWIGQTNFFRYFQGLGDLSPKQLITFMLKLTILFRGINIKKPLADSDSKYKYHCAFPDSIEVESYFREKGYETNRLENSDLNCNLIGNVFEQLTGWIGYD